MKKILFFLSFATLLSCTKSDDDSSNNSSGANYHPPSWIQGTWGTKASQSISEQPVYKFETDNVCQLISITSLCWKEMANQYKNTGINFVAEDTSTASTYEAKVGAGGQIITLKFVRISATQIKWVNTGIGMDIIYDKLK